MSRVKNPCKICLQTVNRKNGIQCKGVCHNWVHYSCLNYTPGKIRDIKDGIIKITCPCPDCQSSDPKECCMKKPVNCTTNDKMHPIKSPQQCMHKSCPSTLGTKNIQTSEVICQTHSKKCWLERCEDNIKMSSIYASPSLSSGISSTADVSVRLSDQAGDSRSGGGTALPGLKEMEQMCTTVGQLTCQLNELVLKMQHAVKETGAQHQTGCWSPPNQVCKQKGSSVYCPKPCYCPGNPSNRKK